MTTGATFASFAAGLSALVGVGVDFIHKPAFGTITRSLTDFAVLGKIPGTTYYMDYYAVGYFAISFVVVYTSLKLFGKGRRTVKSTLSHPQPEHISL